MTASIFYIEILTEPYLGWLYGPYVSELRRFPRSWHSQEIILIKQHNMSNSFSEIMFVSSSLMKLKWWSRPKHTLLPKSTWFKSIWMWSGSKWNSITEFSLLMKLLSISLPSYPLTIYKCTYPSKQDLLMNNVRF